LPGPRTGKIGYALLVGAAEGSEMSATEKRNRLYPVPDPEHPHGELERGEPYHPARGSKITSAGVTPTGGIPAGAATDRIVPDRSIPTSADNVTPHRVTRGETFPRHVALDEDPDEEEVED
jgi:hypothetical protein